MFHWWWFWFCRGWVCESFFFYTALLHEVSISPLIELSIHDGRWVMLTQQHVPCPSLPNIMPNMVLDTLYKMVNTASCITTKGDLNFKISMVFFQKSKLPKKKNSPTKSEPHSPLQNDKHTIRNLLAQITMSHVKLVGPSRPSCSDGPSQSSSVKYVHWSCDASHCSQ